MTEKRVGEILGSLKDINVSDMELTDQLTFAAACVDFAKKIEPMVEKYVKPKNPPVSEEALRRFILELAKSRRERDGIDD